MNWPEHVKIPFFKDRKEQPEPGSMEPQAFGFVEFERQTYRDGMRGFYRCAKCLEYHKPDGEPVWTTGTAPTASNEIPEHLKRQMAEHAKAHLPK